MRTIAAVVVIYGAYIWSFWAVVGLTVLDKLFGRDE